MKTHAFRPSIGMICVAFAAALATVRGETPAAVPSPRVALVEFTSEDNLCRSAEAADQLGALVQGELLGGAPGPGAGLEWIERAQWRAAAEELHLSAGGWTSGAGALRLGRWLKADLLVLGRFTRNGSERDVGAGHTLTLEVVDAARADALASRAIAIPGDRRDPVTADPALVGAAVAGLREALAEARVRLATANAQRIVAPLFFRNVDASPRLDAFGGQLVEAFAETARQRTTGGGVRVLRFPRAGDSLEEAELSVLGLVENDPARWARVADLYVWGSYRELPAGSLPFAQTPVEVTLSLWEGSDDPPREITQRASVAELPALAQGLVRTVLDAASGGTGVRTPSPAAREEVARTLLERGKQLGRTVESFGPRKAAFLDTAEGRSLRREQMARLETACFFAPANREAQLERLRVRWPGFPNTPPGLPLRQQWQRANELCEFVDRFPEPPPDAATPNGERLAVRRVNAFAGLLGELNSGEKQLHAGYMKHGGDAVLPADATPGFIQGWRGTLEARFAREVDAYAQVTPLAPNAFGAPTDDGSGTWIYAALHEMRDAVTSVRVVETLWPRFSAYYQTHKVHADSDYLLRDLDPLLRQIFAQAGKPQRAAQLLAMPSPPTVASAAVVTPALATPPPNISSKINPKVSPGTPSPPPPGGNSPARPAAENPGDFEAALARLPRLRPSIRTLRFPDNQPQGQAAVNGSSPLPRPACLVHTLSVGQDDTLWISATDPEQRNGATSPPRPGLWHFDPATNALERLPISQGADQQPSAITSILDAGDGQLWLTLALDGIWRVNADEGTLLARFGVAEGLLTPNMDAVVRAPEKGDGRPRFCFAGSREGRPLVNVFDAGNGSWGKMDLGAEAAASPVPTSPPGPPMMPFVNAARGGGRPASFRNGWQLVVSRQWLLMLGATGDGWIYDTEGRRTERLRERVSAAARPNPSEPSRRSGGAPSPMMGFTGRPGPEPWNTAPAGPPQTAVADAAGFWLAVQDRLVFYDPATQRTQSWAAALPADITALAQDGEWLWACFQGPPKSGPTAYAMNAFGTPGGGGYVAAFHKPTGQWGGVFELPGSAGCIAVTRKAIYVALQFTGQPLVEIDKASLPSGR